MIPLPHGFAAVPLPASGLDHASEQELAGFHVIPRGVIFAGPDPQTYAFQTAAFHGNLFRIPLHE